MERPDTVLKYIIINLFGFFGSCYAVNDDSLDYLPASEDQTLTVEEYFSLGIPKTIESPNDIKVIIQKYTMLLNTNIEELPRYDSKKSGSLFEYVTSYESITNITKSLKEYPIQQQFLVNYSFVGNSLANVYTLAMVKNDYYENESVLCSSAKLYAHILFLELFEMQLKQNGQSLKEVGFDQEKRILNSKMIGRTYWGLGEQIKVSNTLDEYVKRKVRKNLDELHVRMKQLKTLDQDIVFDATKCW